MRYFVRTCLPEGVALFIVARLLAAGTSVVLHGPVGQPVCVVESASNSATNVDVEIREPDTPALEARDFASLPMAIRLEDPSVPGAAPRLPAKIEVDVHYLDVEGVDSALGFVRATFPRAWLTAGTVIVGERSRVAPDGRRVSTQTRCAITAADEAHWR